MPKRRRTDPAEAEEQQDTASTTAGSSLTRSDVWMEDGSVVLQAENTQFKVHRGLLARVSPIFADVFSVPQPLEGNLVVEGCPVVHLQDTAEDVRYLMGSLYDQRYHSKKAMPPWVGTALLRLGRKYEIQFLFDEVVARLKAEFPHTLAQYDTPGASSWKEFQVTTNNLQYLTEFAHHSGILEIRGVLPMAYYWSCTRLGVNGIIKGDDDHGPLTPSLQSVCLAGREKLISRFNEAFAWVDNLGTDQFSCGGELRCSTASKELISALWRPEPQISLVLDTWEDFLDANPVVLRRLCMNCFLSAQHALLSCRVETWDELPSYFDLPGWDALNAPT